MTLKKSIFSVFLFVFIQLSGSSLPSLLPVCIRDDPQLANCIINTLYTLRPRLATGDLGDGIKITRLDPVYIPRIVYGREHTLQTRMLDIYVKGLSNFIVESLKVNIKDIMFDVVLLIPRIDIKSNYKMIFGYLGFPLYGEGQIFETLSNLKVRIKVKGRLHNINGQRYLNFDPFYFKVLERSVKFINITNFFPGTVLVRPIVKRFLIDNIDYFNERIAPDFEKSYSEIFTKVANQIALSAPFDEIFPI